MFRLIPENHGDFRAPRPVVERLAYQLHSNSNSQPLSSSSHRLEQDLRAFRPLEGRNYPMIEGPPPSTGYVVAAPRNPQLYVERRPQYSTGSGRQYEEVAPSIFGDGVVRIHSRQTRYSIPASTPDLHIPPPSAPIPIPPPSAPPPSAPPPIARSPQARPSDTTASRRPPPPPPPPPYAPEPPPAVASRRSPSRRAAASTSLLQDPRPIKPELPRAHRPSNDHRHHRTGSHGTQSDSGESVSSRGHSRDGSSTHGSTRSRSDKHTSPPSTPISASPRSPKEPPRRVESSRQSHVRFATRDDSREPEVTMTSDGRRISSYYYPG